MNVDFGRTVADYDRYRGGFPDELFRRVADRGIGLAGQRVIDVGTGTGVLARAWAQRGCKVVGLDASEEMLTRARALDAEGDVLIDYHVAKAERTGLDSGAYDGVSAGESWHWFNRAKASREVMRLLKPGGWLLIASFDWLPLPENVAEATEGLIEKYNPGIELCGGTGLHPAWLRDLRAVGFEQIETFSFDVAVTHTHESWRGRVRSSAAVQASMSPGMVERFDENLRRILEETFPPGDLVVPHCCWALSCRKADVGERGEV